MVYKIQHTQIFLEKKSRTSVFDMLLGFCIMSGKTVSCVRYNNYWFISKVTKGSTYLGVFPLQLHNRFSSLFSCIVQLMTQLFIPTTQMFNL